MTPPRSGSRKMPRLTRFSASFPERRKKTKAKSGALLLASQTVVKQRLFAPDDGFGDQVFLFSLEVGQLEHDISHDFLDDAAQAAGSRVALAGHLSDNLQRLRREVEFGPFHLE